MEQKIIKVEGMSCEHCAKAVAKAVGDLGGTANVKVDLKNKTVSFEHDASKTSLKEIEAAIVEEGYTVSP